ncbi:MAG: hypothetical protein JNL04_08335 [Rhodospirillaceae bacterium]|nr:hypothetical protein [Rhodospirillaceae bacterium]
MMTKRMVIGPLLAVLVAGSAAAQTPGGPPVNLSLGSVSASSSVYAFSVGLAGAVRKYDPAISVTAVEGGGGFDHARLMKQKVLDFSVSGSPATMDAVRRGTGGFQREGAWEPVRLMFMRNFNVTRIYVRADAAQKSGIRTWSNLSKQPFNPGVPGTRDMQRVIEANQMFSTGVTMLPGSLDDAGDQLRTGRIIGMAKGSPHDRFDAAMLAAHYSTPLTVIGFTAEQAARLKEKDPIGNTFVTTPKGGIRDLPEIGPIEEMNSAVMVMSSSNMSQAVAYRLIKAVYAGWKEINEAFPPTAGLDPVRDAIGQTPDVDGMVFHAGIIQYAKERNIPVPARFIPPEYVGPK